MASTSAAAQGECVLPRDKATSGAGGALHAARDQLILAAGVIADSVITLTGAIGQLVLANLMPDRRVRTSPCVVKRAISKYNAKGTGDRTTYKTTISINILAHPNLDNQDERLTTWPWI